MKLASIYVCLPQPRSLYARTWHHVVSRYQGTKKGLNFARNLTLYCTKENLGGGLGLGTSFSLQETKDERAA